MRTIGRILLGVVTGMALVSHGGAVIAGPLLAALHLWAARGSTVPGRVGWALAAGLCMAEWAWGVVYLTVGEAQPAIWLMPLAGGLLAMTLVVYATTRA